MARQLTILPNKGKEGRDGSRNNIGDVTSAQLSNADKIRVSNMGNFAARASHVVVVSRVACNPAIRDETSRFGAEKFAADLARGNPVGEIGEIERGRR